MAEIRTKDTDVIAATVPHPDNGLGCDLIGNAKPRRERLPVIANIAVQSIRTVTGNADNSFLRVGKTAVALSVHGFGHVQLPSQTEIETQLGSHAPGVLAVEEETILSLCGSQAAANESVHVVNVAQQEAADAVASHTFV